VRSTPRCALWAFGRNLGAICHFGACVRAHRAKWSGLNGWYVVGIRFQQYRACLQVFVAQWSGCFLHRFHHTPTHAPGRLNLCIRLPPPRVQGLSLHSRPLLTFSASLLLPSLPSLTEAFTSPNPQWLLHPALYVYVLSVTRYRVYSADYL
jgi:hypothetical protein